jgi:hypothetical protein
MKDLLDKLSSYNLFNYLLPGVVFSAIADKVTKYSFIQSDIITGVFFYYFIGLIISRFGSLTIEPFLKWISFLSFAEYSDFVSASKKDAKLEVLSEVNNTYRTICSLFVVLLLLKFYEAFEARIPSIKEWSSLALILPLLVMFLFSYKKQTSYITRRIQANQTKDDKDA